MKRRLPNPTLAELNISLPVIASLVFVFSVAFCITIFFPPFHAVSAEEAAGIQRAWEIIALIALLFAILHLMYGLLEITRGKQSRKITAIGDFLAAGIQLYFWYGANRFADLATDIS